MFIDNTNEVVNPQNLVSDEEIISIVYAICPQVVFTNILRRDYSNYIDSVPEHCNNIILDGIMDNFSHIVNKHFIEVIEDASFDYEYGDICSVHHCTVTSGYVRRTPELESVAIDDYEDIYDDYYQSSILILKKTNQ